MGKNKFNELVSTVWNYLQMHQQVTKSDCILALGSHDVRVAQRAADLYNQGFAPYIVFSGGFGRLTGNFPKPEAEVFADQAIKMGVPASKLILEKKSTNTGENIKFSMELLKQMGLTPNSFILISKPCIERRAYATFKKFCPHLQVIVTSPMLDFEHCPYDGFSKEDMLNIMLGELQRIKYYPEKGYHIYQDIPENVWNTYNELVALGYNKQLIKIIN